MVTALFIDENTIVLEFRTTSLPLVRGSIVVSIPARHAGDPARIPGRGVACVVERLHVFKGGKTVFWLVAASSLACTQTNRQTCASASAPIEPWAKMATVLVMDEFIMPC